MCYNIGYKRYAISLFRHLAIAMAPFPSKTPFLQEGQVLDLSDKNLRIKRSALAHKPGYKFPLEKRIEVVTKWMALGNQRLVAELTGVSYELVRLWKRSDWWKELEAEIRASRQIQVDNKLSRLIDKSLETISDRLENGELKYNSKENRLERIPVSLLTANKVANDMLTRQNELSKMVVAETSTEANQSIKDQITMLAAEFAKFNTKRTVDLVDAKAADISERDVDAIHEEGSWEHGEKKSSWESGVQPIDSSGTVRVYERSKSEMLSEKSWETDEEQIDPGTA